MVVKIKTSFKGGPLRVEINEAAMQQYIGNVLTRAEVSSIARILNGPKTGAKYSSLPNRSSAPGEAPANQTGELASSHQTQITGPRTGVLRNTAEHEQYLEFGSVGGKIAPRPHLMPGLETGIDQTPIPKDIIKVK